MLSNKSLVGPVVLIVLGLVFLLSNLGMLPPLGALLVKWWPLILIAVGLARLARRWP